MRFFTLCLVVLFLTPRPSFAQTDFIVDGARWVYFRDGFLGDPYNPIIQFTAEYTGDTLIGNADAKRLHIEKNISNVPGNSGFIFTEFDRYVSRSADSVLIWVDNNWEFIFDFNVAQGDTRIVYIGDPNYSCFIHDTMLIDSVWYSDYQGLQLRTIDCRILTMDWAATAPWGQSFLRYKERIGLLWDHPVLNSLCGTQNPGSYVGAGFNCYTDTELINAGADACDVILSTPTSIQETPSNMFYSEGMLVVQHAANSTVRVYSILGKEFLQTQITSDNQSINLSHLPNGILLVVVEGSESRITKKVVNVGS